MKNDPNPQPNPSPGPNPKSAPKSVIVRLPPNPKNSQKAGADQTTSAAATQDSTATNTSKDTATAAKTSSDKSSEQTPATVKQGKLMGFVHGVQNFFSRKKNVFAAPEATETKNATTPSGAQLKAPPEPATPGPALQPVSTTTPEIPPTPTPTSPAQKSADRAGRQDQNMADLTAPATPGIAQKTGLPEGVIDLRNYRNGKFMGAFPLPNPEKVEELCTSMENRVAVFQPFEGKYPEIRRAMLGAPKAARAIEQEIKKLKELTQGEHAAKTETATELYNSSERLSANFYGLRLAASYLSLASVDSKVLGVAKQVVEDAAQATKALSEKYGESLEAFIYQASKEYFKKVLARRYSTFDSKTQVEVSKECQSALEEGRDINMDIEAMKPPPAAPGTTPEPPKDVQTFLESMGRTIHKVQEMRKEIFLAKNAPVELSDKSKDRPDELGEFRKRAIENKAGIAQLIIKEAYDGYEVELKGGISWALGTRAVFRIYSQDLLFRQELKDTAKTPQTLMAERFAKIDSLNDTEIVNDLFKRTWSARTGFKFTSSVVLAQLLRGPTEFSPRPKIVMMLKPHFVSPEGTFMDPGYDLDGTFFMKPSGVLRIKELDLSPSIMQRPNLTVAPALKDYSARLRLEDQEKKMHCIMDPFGKLKVKQGIIYEGNAEKASTSVGFFPRQLERFDLLRPKAFDDAEKRALLRT